MATTSLQQARHVNAPEVNIALPTINTLYAMPSISQLSSTHTNLAQSNLRNADSDDADYSQSTSREGLRQVYDDMYKFLLVTNFGGR